MRGLHELRRGRDEVGAPTTKLDRPDAVRF